MKKNINLFAPLILIVLCLSINTSLAAEIRTVEGIVKINWSNLQAVVQGSHFHAIFAAYEDFSDKLKKIESSSKDKNSAAYASKIENYNVAILTGNEGYTVIFDLKPSDKIKVDSGMQTQKYIIDASTFQIVHKPESSQSNQP